MDYNEAKEVSETPTTGIQTYRQGDVLFTKIDGIPPVQELAIRASGHILEGESSGHIHRVADRAKVIVWESLQTIGKLFVTVKAPTQIIHEEHGPITLPAGDYEVTRQREYNPEAIRNVTD